MNADAAAMSVKTPFGAVLMVTALVVWFAPVGLTREVDYCYAHDTDRYVLFASKTVYDVVRGNHQGAESLPHCEPLQFWLLNRHGTRYPGLSSIRKMNKLQDLRRGVLANHKEGAGRLCDEDLDALDRWTFSVKEEQENVLTTQGEDELRLLARRFRDRFPELLNQTYKSNLYQFKHTNTQRTQGSAEFFANGLFGTGSDVYIPPPEVNDTLLQPYAMCAKWLDQDGVGGSQEWDMLKDSKLVTNLVRNVSTRLGFTSLEYSDIDTIYDMCRYDKAWDLENTSPWCASFSKDELKILEYMEDLKYYYKSGYGNEINRMLGCELVQDLLNRFRKLVQNDTSETHPKGVFYFSHSSMLHMLQARLGIFRDEEPLKHDNYYTQYNRKWRVSEMGSFAANLVAVLYRCTEGEKYRVLFLGSEHTIDIPECHVGLCSWTDVEKMLGPLVEDCSIEWCNSSNAASNTVFSARHLLLLILFSFRYLL